jgi:tRNA G37 N-methylase TrmD
MWGTIRYQALVNVLAWGTHLTITPLVGRFSMKQQFFRDAISNQMVSLQDFITTTGALEANTIIQITFCVGIKHI